MVRKHEYILAGMAFRLHLFIYKSFETVRRKIGVSIGGGILSMGL